MAAIKKRRARKWAVSEKVGWATIMPDGVGGLEGKPIYFFAIGEFDVYLTKDEVLQLYNAWAWKHPSER